MKVKLRTRRTPQRAAALLALSASLALVLSGCVVLPDIGGAAEGSGPEGAASESPATGAEQPGSDAPDAEDDADDTPRSQAETCDWDSPELRAAVGTVPQINDGDPRDMIVGSWQHTHFDTGKGYEEVSADIRYVFPSSDRLLYCQHVEGVTDHAENATDITWDDMKIVIPGGVAPGWHVMSWDADTMVWLNHADQSHYLLQRR